MDATNGGGGIGEGEHPNERFFEPKAGADGFVYLLILPIEEVEYNEHLMVKIDNYIYPTFHLTKMIRSTSPSTLLSTRAAYENDPASSSNYTNQRSLTYRGNQKATYNISSSYNLSPLTISTNIFDRLKYIEFSNNPFGDNYGIKQSNIINSSNNQPLNLLYKKNGSPKSLTYFTNTLASVYSDTSDGGFTTPNGGAYAVGIVQGGGGGGGGADNTFGLFN